MPLVQQLPGLHQVHLPLGGRHRGGDRKPVETALLLVVERHRASLHATPTLCHFLLVQLEAAGDVREEEETVFRVERGTLVDELGSPVFAVGLHGQAHVCVAVWVAL